MQQLLDGGYYHDAKGDMKVIAHDKFEVMKKREGIGLDNSQSGVDGSGGSNNRYRTKVTGRKGSGKQQRKEPMVT